MRRGRQRPFAPRMPGLAHPLVKHFGLHGLMQGPAAGLRHGRHRAATLGRYAVIKRPRVRCAPIARDRIRRSQSRMPTGSRTATSARVFGRIKGVVGGPRPTKGLMLRSAVGITTTGRVQGTTTLLIRRLSMQPIESV